ncbi:MAG: aspartate aminotransferase family protein [Gammaproteobacteria bacterium]|nr:aspartate aminotransferase family protein [Gammaproteobacteria bacterium]MYE29713.1 aspartate aminotransferase family protein [Gammaproteobacteria bacterium]
MSSALLENYGVRDLALSHGAGSYVWCEAGRKYLDFAQGIAVNSLGHCHPRLVEALTAQAGALWHTSNLFRIPASERLAEKLTGLCFADRAFFCNSGAEAVECGFKMMRRYHYSKGDTHRKAPGGDTHRKRIIGLSDSFHGRTLATIAAAANSTHCEGFLAGDAGFDQVEFGDIDALTAAITEETAGVILEPVQGEGGIRPADPNYLKQVRQLCDENKILLMFDEVQCGVGRTGTFYAHQQLGAEPDILASAKGLGGGFPVGACLAREAVAAPMSVGSHGSTFGGNPLAMSVANAVVDEIGSPDFLEQVRANGDRLMQSLRDMQAANSGIIAGISGLGLMIGVFLNVDAGRFIAQLREEGLLVVKGGNNSVRLLPPLNVSHDEIDQAVQLIATALKKMESK